MSRLSAGKPIELDQRSKILLGVLAFVILAGGAFFLLKGGGKTTDSTANGPVTVPSSVATPKASATPKATASPSPPGADVGSSTRDPFAPLVQEAAATTTTAPTAGGATASATPSVTVTTAPTATTAPTSSTGAHTVTLISIASGSAVLTVDGGSDKTVKAGGDVGSGIACIKVTDDSVFVTYNSKAYAIAPGQTISV